MIGKKQIFFTLFIAIIIATSVIYLFANKKDWVEVRVSRHTYKVWVSDNSIIYEDPHESRKVKVFKAEKGVLKGRIVEHLVGAEGEEVSCSDSPVGEVSRVIWGKFFSQ